MCQSNDLGTFGFANHLVFDFEYMKYCLVDVVAAGVMIVCYTRSSGRVISWFELRCAASMGSLLRCLANVDCAVQVDYSMAVIHQFP